MSFGKVDAGNGLNWLTEAIGIVFRNPAAFLVMALIVAAEDADAATGLLSGAGEQVWKIGVVRESKEGEAQTVVV